MHAITARVMASLELLDHVKNWPDGEQHRANLIRLLALAREFDETDPTALALGGFHGSGIPTFLAWLTEQDNMQPQKNVLDQHAIVLRTMHSAKGLEWPVVVVAGMDEWTVESLPDMRAEYPSFENIGTMLETAGIKYHPKYAIQEKNKKAEDELGSVATQTARRLLYVALTRARNKLILEWPEYRSRPDPARFEKLLRTSGCELDAANEVFVIGDKVFPCKVIEGGVQLPDDYACPAEDLPLPTHGRRAIEKWEEPGSLTIDIVEPSQIEKGAYKVPRHLELGTVSIGNGLVLLDSELESHGLPAEPDQLGVYLHECFEILGNRPDQARRLNKLTGRQVSDEALQGIERSVNDFESWLENRFCKRQGAS